MQTPKKLSATRRVPRSSAFGEFKAWRDADWTRSVTPTLHVSRVDQNLDVNTQVDRKPWYLALTQNPDRLSALGSVRGLPPSGKTLLLFEDEVVALCTYLMESGLVTLTDDGLVNGPALTDAAIDRAARERAAAMPSGKARLTTQKRTRR